MKGFISCIAIICCAIPIISPLHSGGTDGNGGHYDHSTGEYHYHHGYPAHQHPNGECPYYVQEFDCGREGCDIPGQHGHINKPKTTKTTRSTEIQEEDTNTISLSDDDKGFLDSFSTLDKILCCLAILFLPGIIGICFDKLKTFITKRKNRRN